MQITGEKIEVHERGIGRKVRYKVAQNAKIMKMLSDSLYSDKISAVLRELGTNALDGHMKGDNFETPFDLYLPTTDEPEFRLRDFGCGMDLSQLEEMYTTYGDSDKSDSNDFNGCMGIGSKSPFAYCNAFTTTSIKDGLKYVCVNAKDENGIPTLNFLLEGEPTDEPSGLEVSFAVKSDDIGEFQEKAGYIYEYFPVKPYIQRGVIEYRDREYLYEGDGWRIVKDNGHSFATMGYNSYPNEVKHFSKKASSAYSWNYNDTEEAILIDLGVELDFDIGEIEMDISRESLQYNQITIQAITAKLQVVLNVLKDEYSKRFDDCETLWEARVRHQDLTHGKMRKLKSLTKLSPAIYNGIKLDEDIPVTKTLFPDTRFIRFEASQSYREGKYGKPKRTDIVSRIQIPHSRVEGEYRFYLNDLDRGAYSACQRVILDDNNKCGEIILVSFDNNAALDNFCKVMGFEKDYLYKISEVPKNVVNSKGRTVTAKENIFSFKLDKVRNVSFDAQSSRNKNWWNTTSVDISAGGLFVKLNSFKAIMHYFNGRKEVNSGNLGSVLELLKQLGFILPSEVVGIKTVAVKKYRNKKNWVDIFDWTYHKFNEYITTHSVGNDIADIKTIDAFQDIGRYWNIVRNGEVIPDSSPFMIFLNKIREVKAIKERKSVSTSYAKKLADFLEYDFSGQATYDLKAEKEKIENRYEMLSFLDPWDVNDSTRSKVVRYIKSIDNFELTN